MTRARSLSQLANSSVFTVATNNRVGIGSEVPTAKLDVDGTLNVSGNATIGGVATYEDVTNVDSVGIVTARSGVSVPDGQKIQLGNSNDLQIYHTGSHSLIDEAGTGNLTIRSSLISFEKYTNEQLARFTADGSCELFHDNSKKLETTSTGVSVTGSVSATVGSFSGNVTVNRTGSSQVVLEGQLSGSQTSSILANGAATFAGSINSGSITSQSTILSNRTGSTQTAFQATLSGVTKVNITAGGAATFASQVSTSDRFDANRTGSSDSVFNGRLNNTVTTSILADGSATFLGTGRPSGRDTRISLYGSLLVGTTGNNVGTDANCSIDAGNGNIKSSGSADFAGNIETGNYNASSSSGQGVIVYASGALNIQRAAGASVDERFQIRSGTTQVIAMKNDGSVSFASGNFAIDSDGEISTNVKSAGHIELDSTGSFSSPKIKLFANTGAATFAGAVDVGTFSSGTSGIRLTNTGTIYIGGTGNNAGLSIGNSAAVIDYDGSAAFANTIQSGGPTIIGGTNLGSQIGHEGNAVFCSGSTSSAIRVFKQGTSTATVDILGNGTASFTGVTPGYVTATMPSGETASSWGVFTGRSDSSTVTSQIKADGSASFVSGGTTIDSSSGVLVTSSSGAKSQLNGDGFYQIKTDGSTNAATILASGAATFAGHVKSTNGNGSAFLGASSGTGLAINNSSNTTLTELNYDGTASFQNTVLLNRTGSTNTALQVTLNGVTKATINAGGAASFTSVAKGSGSFRIDHPLKPETHQLVHSFVEGPQADNIYRGKVELIDGTATVNIDTVAGMTEGTFVALNREIQCFTTNETGWTAIKGSVTGNLLTIVAQDDTCTDTISWLVIGERQDQHMYDTEWTDENGKVIVEPEKS